MIIQFMARVKYPYQQLYLIITSISHFFCVLLKQGIHISLANTILTKYFAAYSVESLNKIN